MQHRSLGEHRVVDLVAHLGLAQSTVSRHLACLLDCGLVTMWPEGRASIYALAHPEATMDLLRGAERLLGLTGTRGHAAPAPRGWGGPGELRPLSLIDHCRDL